MSKLPLYAGLALALFMLSACGEGWEMKLTKSYFPYGNARTAGSGVAYVLARMKPPRELNVTPKPEARGHDVLEKLDEDVEKMFREQIKK